MNRVFLKDGLGWGVGLWLIGYVLGIVLFMMVPPEMLGWVITPIGTAITLWVLFKKIQAKKMDYYFKLGVVWAGVAIVFDYIFLVQLFKPEDGYYKLDVYLYYLLALALPVLVGWYKLQQGKK